MDAGTWIRSTRRTRGFAVVWALMGLFWLAGAVVGLEGALTVAPTTADVVGGLAFALLFGGASAGFGLFARGCLRAGVRIEADGVVVRNPIRCTEVPLAAVESFAAELQPAAGPGNPTPGIVLRLVDGSRVRVWALAREGLVWNGERNRDGWSPTAERLNALLQSLRPVASLGPGEAREQPVVGVARADGTTAARASGSRRRRPG